MSRHVLTPLPDRDVCEVVAGWDERLGTYFSQVMVQTPEGEISFPVRTGLTETVIDPTVVLDAIRDYAHIPEHFHITLLVDCLVGQ
ncbi:hypothetical protein F0L68_35440 [Solihabitans fulvus]|uniref:Uncharacterized protein n=1 Tax=Solihabitans fulvus TaxID=1892852 RepID=A0A5B2WNI6_9PSEU|nr:hypothetical protein [Solihabitans fulvus]KAA2252350.1 hypothetical protein F0L68_35440 [Solihabitans fulvus]